MSCVSSWMDSQSEGRVEELVGGRVGGLRDDGEPLQQLRLREHARTERRYRSAKGLRQEQRGHLRHVQRPRDAVVAAESGELRQARSIDADRDDLDAVARLEGPKDRTEGVAIGTVAAEEEEEHVVAR